MMFLGNLNIEVNKNSIKQGVELNWISRFVEGFLRVDKLKTRNWSRQKTGG